MQITMRMQQQQPIARCLVANKHMNCSKAQEYNTYTAPQAAYCSGTFCHRQSGCTTYRTLTCNQTAQGSPGLLFGGLHYCNALIHR